jgi:Tol biopolymer transport system component
MSNKLRLLLIALLLLLAACLPGAVEPGPPTEAAYPAPPVLQKDTTTPETYPPPMPTAPPFTPEPEPTEPPTPTNSPIPTPIPTPIVTPIPTAAPPIIPLPLDQAPELFTILFPEDNTIWAVNSDGTDPRSLVDIQAELPLYLASDKVGIQKWGEPSPDGSQLAIMLSTVAEYTNDKGETPPQFSIYLFDRQSLTLRLLVENGVEPAWSPDGTRIAYRSTETSGLWTVDVAAGKTREVYAADRENEHYVTEISWSPDSKRLVFLDQVFRQSAAIVTAYADQTEPANVLISSTTYWPYLPQWSPNSEQILFVWPSGENPGPNKNYDLWVINADGSGQTQLTQDIDVLAGGASQWSPDGNWIVFGGTKFYEESEPLTDIWLVDKSGANLKRLTTNSINRANESGVQWSSDGMQLLFIRNQSSVWSLSLIDAVETNLTSVTTSFILLP